MKTAIAALSATSTERFLVFEEELPQIIIHTEDKLALLLEYVESNLLTSF